MCVAIMANNKDFIITNIYNNMSNDAIGHADASFMKSTNLLFDDPRILSKTSLLHGDFNLYHKLWENDMSNRNHIQPGVDLITATICSELNLVNHIDDD